MEYFLQKNKETSEVSGGKEVTKLIQSAFSSNMTLHRIFFFPLQAAAIKHALHSQLTARVVRLTIREPT